MDSYVLLFQAFIDVVLKHLKKLISNALFAAVINKIATQAINRQNPNDAPLHHPVKITGPGPGKDRNIQFLLNLFQRKPGQ